MWLRLYGRFAGAMPSSGARLRESGHRKGNANRTDQANPKEQGVSPVDLQMSDDADNWQSRSAKSGKPRRTYFSDEVTRITVAIVGDNVDKKSEPGAVSDRSGIQDESDLKPKPPNWKNATAQKSSLGPGRYRFGSDI